MEIKRCASEQQFEEMMAMAKNHPEPEYDCTYAEFFEVCKKLFRDPAFQAWILYADGKPIGYVSGYRNRGVRNEINIVDLYLSKEVWGKNLIRILIDKIYVWAVEDKALRVTWTSLVSAKAWSRISGLDISEKRILVWEVR